MCNTQPTPVGAAVERAESQTEGKKITAIKM